MEYTDLNDIKKHLRVDESYTDDDTYITELCTAAEAIVARDIDDSLDGLADSNRKLPEPLNQAIKILVGNFYANRESVAYTSISQVPLSYQYILDLYRNYSNTKSNGEEKC